MTRVHDLQMKHTGTFYGFLGGLEELLGLWRVLCWQIEYGWLGFGPDELAQQATVGIPFVVL